jgi:hypothetical protein
VRDDTVQTRQIEFTVEQYCASVLMDEHNFNTPQVKALMQYRMENLAHCLTVVLKTPAQVLQRDKVLATYPTTWWDAVKQRLGWKHKRTEIRLNEHLIFPHVDLPDVKQLRHRLVYIEPRTTFCAYEDDAPIES